MSKCRRCLLYRDVGLHNFIIAFVVVVVYPLHVHLASSAVAPAGFVHKSRGENVVRVWVQLKR